MTRRAKRAPAEAPPAHAYLAPVAGDDSRAMFRLQGLMQDYDDLLKVRSRPPLPNPISPIIF